MKNIIAKSTLNVPLICSKSDTIFLSASGSQIAEAKLYITVIIASFIIGKAHIPIITIIPTIPREFFKREVAPITMSADSPKALPITGTKVVIAAFIPFAASPSTLLVSSPSNDSMLTNIVITIPKVQVIPDFRNLESFSICIFSERLDIIPSVVAIRAIGRIKKVIVFEINTIENIINGCTKVTDATFPTCTHKRQ